jgi:hypothetical protein
MVSGTQSSSVLTSGRIPSHRNIHILIALLVLNRSGQLFWDPQRLSMISMIPRKHKQTLSPKPNNWFTHLFPFPLPPPPPPPLIPFLEAGNEEEGIEDYHVLACSAIFLMPPRATYLGGTTLSELHPHTLTVNQENALQTCLQAICWWWWGCFVLLFSSIAIPVPRELKLLWHVVMEPTRTGQYLLSHLYSSRFLLSI